MKTTRWLLLDTETTGLGAPIFVVELAAQRMRKGNHAIRATTPHLRIFWQQRHAIQGIHGNSALPRIGSSYDHHWKFVIIVHILCLDLVSFGYTRSLMRRPSLFLLIYLLCFSVHLHFPSHRGEKDSSSYSLIVVSSVGVFIND